jgi:hypothetical protein
MSKSIPTVSRFLMLSLMAIGLNLASQPLAKADGCSSMQEGLFRKLITLVESAPAKPNPVVDSAIEDLRAIMQTQGSALCFEKEILKSIERLIRNEIENARLATDRIPVHVDGGTVLPQFNEQIRQWFSLFVETFPSQYFRVLNGLNVPRVKEIEERVNARLSVFLSNPNGTHESREIKRVLESIDSATRSTEFWKYPDGYRKILKKVPRLTESGTYGQRHSGINGIRSYQDAIEFAPSAIQAWNESPLRALRPELSGYFDEQGRRTALFEQLFLQIETGAYTDMTVFERSDLAQNLLETLYPGLLFDIRTPIREDRETSELLFKALEEIKQGAISLNQVVLLMMAKAVRVDSSVIRSLSTYFKGLTDHRGDYETSTEFAVYYLNLEGGYPNRLSDALYTEVQKSWKLVLDELYEAGTFAEGRVDYSTYFDRIKRVGLDSRYSRTDLGYLKKNNLLVEVCDRFLKRLSE